MRISSESRQNLVFEYCLREEFMPGGDGMIEINTDHRNKKFDMGPFRFKSNSECLLRVLDFVPKTHSAGHRDKTANRRAVDIDMFSVRSYRDVSQLARKI